MSEIDLLRMNRTQPPKGIECRVGTLPTLGRDRRKVVPLAQAPGLPRLMATANELSLDDPRANVASPVNAMSVTSPLQ